MRSLRNQPAVVSVSETARILGVSAGHICHLLDKGTLIPWFAPADEGKEPRRMVTAQSIRNYLEQGAVTATAKAQIAAYQIIPVRFGR